MTPRERAKIYRKLAEDVFVKRHTVCEYLLGIIIGSDERLPFEYNKPDAFMSQIRATEKAFPEFYLFKPDNVMYNWWDYLNDSNGKYRCGPGGEYSCRVLALLFAEQLALDAA